MIDWRAYPALVATAERARANGIGWTDQHFDFLFDYCGQVAPEEGGTLALFCLAILPQEGTGSFNTSAENRAGDGGHGIETDWHRDVRKAVDLVAGKLALYPQAVSAGFVELAKGVWSPAAGKPVQADGFPDQWVNWSTAILRDNRRVDVGPYALHASWWVGVRRHFSSFGGSLDRLVKLARSLDKQAPRVRLAMRYVYDQVGLGSNWNATAPEPAIVVTEATVTWDPVGEIRRLRETGLINTQHAPDAPVTWGQLATILLRLPAWVARMLKS